MMSRDCQQMIRGQSEKPPERAESQTLTDYAETLSDWYVRHQSLDYRKKRGQYFTPKRVSEFMAQLVDDIHADKELRILDPGAGVGNFESALCEHAKLRTTKVHLSFDLYEDCQDMIPLLEMNMRACRKSMAQEGIDISYRILKENFILARAAEFLGQTSNRKYSDEFLYDLVICNPPYHKLKKNSSEAVAMKTIVKGQPNIYVLFMAMGAKLVRDGGQLVILTPRSYCSGTYFSEFRKWFFGQITPVRLHEFESRRLLKTDPVLQEMVILKGKKGCERPDNITISVSYQEPKGTEELTEIKVPFNTVVVSRDEDVRIQIPATKTEELVIEQVERLPFTLTSLGFKASTGPVVPFRAKEYLLNTMQGGGGCAPLIWMENIDAGKVFWPSLTQKNEKPMALSLGEKTSRLCIPDSNYVLIKRFSVKEGKRRINAGVLIRGWLNTPLIAVENHVNYIHKIGGDLTEDEAYGLAKILNSTLYNLYTQASNGSTQVNASELNVIPLPSSEVITTIGRYVRSSKTGESVASQRFTMMAIGIESPIIDLLLGDH